MAHPRCKDCVYYIAPPDETCFPRCAWGRVACVLATYRGDEPMCSRGRVESREPVSVPSVWPVQPRWFPGTAVAPKPYTITCTSYPVVSNTDKAAKS